MNFFRTLRASNASYTGLRDVILRRRFADERTDLPAEADLIAFVESLTPDQFHILLVICGAFMAKARGLDVFSLPVPPESPHA